MAGKRRAAKHSKSPPRDDWCTPQIVADLVHEHFELPISLDPAANPRQLVRARIYNLLKPPRPKWQPTGGRIAIGNGLDIPWHGSVSRVFFNPPYGRGVNRAWAKKAYDEAQHGTEIIGLVPSSPGANWWDYYWAADRICFWRGRLTFLGAKLSASGRPEPADFESAIVYFGARRHTFENTFEPYGRVVEGDYSRGLRRWKRAA
jgi:hypothetical protein